MFEIIESGSDEYGLYQIARNHLTATVYKRVSVTNRKKQVWSSWFRV